MEKVMGEYNLHGARGDRHDTFCRACRVQYNLDRKANAPTTPTADRKQCRYAVGPESNENEAVHTRPPLNTSFRHGAVPTKQPATSRRVEAAPEVSVH